MQAIVEAYEQECRNQNVKINSKVVADLKKIAQAGHNTAPLTVWDLRNTMIGTKGAKVVLQIVKTKLPDLEKLILSGSNLSSPFTKDLLDAVVDHTALREIDLSDNDIRLGGPELVELVKRNRLIVDLNIERTHLRNLFVRLIEIQLRKNAEKLGFKRESDKKKEQEQKAEEEAEDPFAAGWGNGNEKHINDDSDANPFGAFSSDKGGEPSPFGGAHRFSFGTPTVEGDNPEDDEAARNFSKVQFNAVNNEGKKKMAAPRRPTVSSEVYKEEEVDNFEVPEVAKDESASLWLLSVLERHDLFSHLEDYELTVAVSAMPECKRLKGEELFAEGDEDNDIFYIVADGAVELKSSKPGSTKTVTRNGTIHDLCLLYPSASPETATCLEDTTLYTLDRQTYKIILTRSSKKKRAMYEGFLQTVNFLKEASLSKHELLQLADSLKSANYNPGEALISYGEVGESFFIIVEGTVEVYGRDDEGGVKKVCEFTVGDCVGELEFLKSHRCVADVKAKNSVRTAKMNRLHFEMVMGPVKDVLARTAGESEVYSYYREQLEKMEKGGAEPSPARESPANSPTKSEE